MRVFYLRDEAGFPVACVASDKAGDKINVALSALSPKDKLHFDRKRGHDIAVARLNKGKLFTSLEAGDNVKERLCRVIAETSDSEMARNAAKRWLLLNRARAIVPPERQIGGGRPLIFGEF